MSKRRGSFNRNRYQNTVTGEIGYKLSQDCLSKPRENGIPQEFFNNFKFQGKTPIKEIRFHLAYLVALIASKEAIVAIDLWQNYEFSDILSLLTHNVELKYMESSCVPKDMDESNILEVSNSYIYEIDFDETYRLMHMVGFLYASFCMVAKIWEQGDLNDDFFLDMVEFIIKKIQTFPLKKETDLVFGPYQYTAFKIAEDFIKQVGEGDFYCSPKAKALYETIQSKKFTNLEFTESCKNLTDDDINKIIEMMSWYCFESNKHKDSDEIALNLKPYLSQECQQLMNLYNEKSKFLYEGILRQVYFSTAVMSNAANSHLSRMMYSDFPAFAEIDELTDCFKKEKEILKKSIDSRAEEIKKYKTLFRTAQKEVQDLKKYKTDNEKAVKPEIERLEAQVKKLTSENDSLRNAANEAKAQEAVSTSKAVKYKTRIESLESSIEEQNKQIAKLGREKSEFQELCESLTNDMTSFYKGANTTDDLFSDENIETAKKCEFAFFVPSYVDSTPLINYFPNSRFIKSQENDTFELGSSTKAIIMCTKGIPHGTYWRAEKQANQLGIEVVEIPSFGVRRIFGTAVAQYQKNITEAY